ncbi:MULTISPECIES: Maf family protein [Psychrobacter]|uniref:Maf family protein n=1 Tax=Psychrobacter TaxID=497 RepID=UPI00191A3C83|nr:MULTISPECIES: Maf family protein [Psychrobacter]
MDIILASGSPRRRELLATAQLEFSTISVDIDETPYEDEHPKNYIQRMVVSKATAAIKQLNACYKNDQIKSSKFSDPFIILTADTIGVLPDGKTVLVKPTDREHAYSMWQQMSNNSHQVWTAVQVTKVTHLVVSSANDGDKVLQAAGQQQILERTDVTFVPLTANMMANYWDSGEPADKAGGYGIQGLAAAWVTRINGSYTNVVGLPLAQTLALINQATNHVINNPNDK